MIDSLKNSEGFLEIISKGQKFTISGLTFYFLRKNDLNESKVGISIKKKTGNAVYRNKLKRQIKNLYLWSCEVGKNKNLISLFSELTGAKVFCSSLEISRPVSYTHLPLPTN